MIVKQITPGLLSRMTSPGWTTSTVHKVLLVILVVIRRASARWLLCDGKISITNKSAGRQRGAARIIGGPEGDGTARIAVPEPASRAGDRSGVPGRGVLRYPRRGAGQVRDGAPRHARRRAGHRDGRGVRVLAAVVLPGRRRTSRLRPGRPGAGQARTPRRPQAHRADPRLGRGAAGGRSAAEGRRPRSLIAAEFGVRVHPRSVERALARHREHPKSR